ncbi:MAG: hypothetical protein IT209_03015 [Armatimonadetes bacterium]|nr:hypothetical protein [Armatimonadota bacterium]
MRLLICPVLTALTIAGLALSCSAQTQNPMPRDFPTFQVPGFEQDMQTLRDLFWLHYPGAGPKATIWDEWLPMPSLWPAVESDGTKEQMRQQWRSTLLGRIIDAEGYVATHQHQSIAHQLGWPFPFWNNGSHTMGWHFSFKNTVGPPWRQGELNTTDGWSLKGATDAGMTDDGWALKLTDERAIVTTPEHDIDTFQSPFLQIRWKADGLAMTQPYVEWRAKDEPFSPQRRVYFDPAGSDIVYTMIPMDRHPLWRGHIQQLRIGFGNTAPASATIQAFFTQFDSRQNINNQVFVMGSAEYFRWTGDLSFLRANINRMRTAIQYLMTDQHGLEKSAIYTDWRGHNGVSGAERKADGSKVIHAGVGIGNNYWDLMPFGALDAYATIRYYVALKDLAQLERAIAANPAWNIPPSQYGYTAEFLEKHAEKVKAHGNRVFWNSETGRFVACIDEEGKAHDYGFTFLNLESIYYGFATPAHAKQILAWVEGKRVVKGDTSTGPDIYHWRFGPRSTTKRNIDWYFWAWSAPETIPFGGQVQDGGAVLGWSYYDLMSRAFISGPDNACGRLQEIAAWFREVQAAGGYRAYYKDGRDGGTLQGNNTAGGLGMDAEFFESVLVPQVLLRGFLGFKAGVDGFSVNPLLPSSWPELRVDRIAFRDLVLCVTARPDEIQIDRESGLMDDPCTIYLPKGNWTPAVSGRAVRPKQLGEQAWSVDWHGLDTVTFRKGSAN